MKYANHISYSDVEPFEVIRVISEQTLEIREMDAVRDDSVKLEFHVGGFSAHCSNQNEQKWAISSNANNRVIRIRKGKKGWKDAHGRRFVLDNEPIKFYDYNF